MANPEATTQNAYEQIAIKDPVLPSEVEIFRYNPTTAERVTQHVQSVLEENPYHWFSVKRVAKTVSVGKKKAKIYLSTHPEVNIVKLNLTEDDLQILDIQIQELQQVGLKRDEIIKKLGGSRYIKEPAMKIMDSLLSVPVPDIEEIIKEDQPIKDLVSRLRMDFRYGNHETQRKINSVFPGRISLAQVTEIIERLIAEKPEHRLRRRRGSLIGDHDLVSQVSFLYKNGMLPKEIEDAIDREDITNVDISNLLNRIDQRDPTVKRIGRASREHIL